MKNNNHPPKTKTTTMKNNNNNRSMSDTDDEFHSPGHFPIHHDSSTALVIRSPTSNHHHHTHTALSFTQTAREQPLTAADRPPTVVSVSQPQPRTTEEGGGEKRSRNVGRDVMLNRAALGFRVLEVVLTLIAFSVMAADKTQGWSGDSFDRYKEYRYVVAVNAIAFAYAAFQAIDMTYRLFYDKFIVSSSLRPLFDFLFDQILAYLLISASSSAASRVDDWVSNWGKDDFTEMATASTGMSFLAFIAFALTSIISGYNLCNQKSV